MTTRHLGVWQVAALLVSASYGIGFLFGSGEMALTHGMAGALYGLATALGMLVLALFARQLWLRGLPIWALFGERFGPRLQGGVALLSLVWMAGVLAAQVHGGLAVVRLLGVSAPWDQLLLLALIYAASRLDLGVASRVFGACLLMSAAVLTWALFVGDGVSVYRNSLGLLARDLPAFDPVRAVTTALAVFVLVCLGADYHQFVVAARRPIHAVLGCAGAAAALFALAFLPPAVVVAMQQAGAIDGLIDPKQVMPHVLARVAAGLGSGAYALMLATLGIAALGAAAAITRAMVSALGTVVAGSSPARDRALPAVVLLLGALLAARGQAIIDTMVSVNVIYIASVAVPFVMLFTGRRLAPAVVPAAVAAGFLAALSVYVVGWWGGMGTNVDAKSLAAGVVASLLPVLAFAIRARSSPSVVASPSA